MSGAENQKSKNPITLKIKFKSSSLDQFIERYSVDVSKSGIFIRTKDPLAVGTVLRFEFQLQDGTPLIGGDGTVVWNRPFDANKQSVAPGMGVRFDKLTADSQRILDQILGEKDRRGETQMESRFDAGVRASQSMNSEAGLAQSQTTPQAQSQFGDEPTRALPADQMHKLAEAMQHGAMEEDQPTRRGSIQDLPEDMRKLAVKALTGEKSGQLGNSSQELPAPANKPPASLARTLIGAGAGGFAMAGKGAVPTPAKPAAETSPAKPAAEPSPSAITPVQAAPLPAESKRTPTNPTDEKAISSDRTPTGPTTPAALPVATPAAPLVAAAASAAVSSSAAAAVKSTDVAAVKPPTPSSSPKGLLIGTVVLLGAVAAAGYIYLTMQKPVTPPQPQPQPPITQPVTPPPVVAPSTPLPPPEPVKPVEATGPGEKTGTKPPEAGKPEAANDSLEVTTEPPGAQVELAGKPVGMTPTRLSDLAVGKVYEIKVTLAGYQEVRQKVKRAEGENKPVVIKLQAIERLVEVNSLPKGIDVYLDGKKVGKTPTVLKKLDFSKPHTVEIKKTGFETWSHNITDAETFVVKNKKEVLTLNATLEAQKGGGRTSSRGTRKPDGAAPATPAKPDDAKAPEAAKPEAAKPADAPKPEAAKPADAPKPEAAKPADAPKPAAAKPAAPKADAPKAGSAPAEDAPN